MSIDFSGYRLVPHLVPKPLWGKSIHKSLSRGKWNKIRASFISEADNKCASCCVSHEKGMICHEVWVYSITDHIAELDGFMLTCRDCNFVHHIGKASTLGRQEEAILHMMRINQIDREEALAVTETSLEEWSERSAITDWKILIPQALIEEYPDLSAINL